MLPGQLLLQEDAAPDHGGHAVGGDDGGGEGHVLGIGQGVDIEELADGLENGAGVLGRLLPGDQLLLLDAQHVDGAEDAHDQEGQLIGAVGAVLVQHLQHAAVGKGAQRVQQAVDDGDQNGDPALGVVVVGGVLPGAAELLVLVGLGKAQGDDADADQGHGHQGHGGQILADAHGEKGQHRDDGAGAVADGGGDGQLDVPQAQIADGHGEDVQHGDRQIGQNDLPAHLHAAREDLIGRVQAHDEAHGRHHFQMAVLVLSVLAADLGEQVRAAPAEQRDDCEGKPHACLSSCAAKCGLSFFSERFYHSLALLTIPK